MSRKALLNFYRERGYYRADVDLELDREAGRVIFTVREGDSYELAALEAQGVEFFTEGEILAGLKSLERESDGSRPLREDFLQSDRKRIEDRYLFSGFLEVEVLPPLVRLDALPEGAEVRFSVREGPQSVVEEILFRGLTAEEEREMREVIKSRAGEPYRRGWVTRDMELILRAVSDRGYPHCRVSENIPVK